jgi:hypothetical protein
VSSKKLLTRDCLDPWSYFQLKADGNLFPCCGHESLGMLELNQDFSELLSGDKIKKIQKGILSGELDGHCSNCIFRPLTPVYELRRRFISKFFLSKFKLTSNNEVEQSEFIKLSNYFLLRNLSIEEIKISERILIFPKKQLRQPFSLAFKLGITPKDVFKTFETRIHVKNLVERKMPIKIEIGSSEENLTVVFKKELDDSDNEIIGSILHSSYWNIFQITCDLSQLSSPLPTIELDFPWFH